MDDIPIAKKTQSYLDSHCSLTAQLNERVQKSLKLQIRKAFQELFTDLDSGECKSLKDVIQIACNLADSKSWQFCESFSSANHVLLDALRKDKDRIRNVSPKLKELLELGSNTQQESDIFGKIALHHLYRIVENLMTAELEEMLS